MIFKVHQSGTPYVRVYKRLDLDVGTVYVVRVGDTDQIDIEFNEYSYKVFIDELKKAVKK